MRNPQGGLLGALASNLRVSLLYRSTQPRMLLIFEGRGRGEHAEARRTTVYERSPEPERTADPERRGVAMIIDLDRVTGFTPAGRVLMQRPT